MDKNLFSDMEQAWAEYEFVKNHIKTKITSIIQDTDSCYESGDFIEIQIYDKQVIVLVAQLSLACLKRIEDFLGVDACITATKKGRLKIIFDSEE